MKTPFLLPFPKTLDLKAGTFTIKNGYCLLIPLEDKEELYFTATRLQRMVKEQLNIALPRIVEKKGMYAIAVSFAKDSALEEEEYGIEIFTDHIVINYKAGAGAFHAISTLKQLIVQYGKILPCLKIKDAPDYKARGIMLDVSRDKIPAMDTLYRLIDFMADIKLNQLQLYIEGFSFAYPTYPFVWQEGTPITGEEILELDCYCKQRYIRLVPNQNSFGHMDKWLALDEFKDLAVAPLGYEVDWMRGTIHKPSSLDPSDKRSIELVDQMTSDLLPYFSSGYLNVGCDETFDLEHGKGEEICKKYGIGRVYLDFLLKVYEVTKKYGKKMMFWGDIIIKHPELICELPKDIIALEWGYEANHRFAEDGEKFKNAGLEFYVCPGTSTWDAITGRTDNMKANLLNAAVNGRKHGATGFLNTDWGDAGHWQYQLFSYPGFVYGAALSWDVDQNRETDIAAFLNKALFVDGSNLLGQLVMEIGNYYLLEKAHRDNVTMIFWTLHVDFEDVEVTEGFTAEDYENIKKYVSSLEDRLSQVQIQCNDAELIEAEFRNAALFITHGCNLGILKLYMKNKISSIEIKSFLKHMIEEVTVLIRRHENLWLSRNRHGGLVSSVHRLKRLREEYLKMNV